MVVRVPGAGPRTLRMVGVDEQLTAVAGVAGGGPRHARARHQRGLCRGHQARRPGRRARLKIDAENTCIHDALSTYFPHKSESHSSQHYLVVNQLIIIISAEASEGSTLSLPRHFSMHRHVANYWR